jgi:aryl-alcohol dehydrogenase-like predicted oxidoreductase
MARLWHQRLYFGTWQLGGQFRNLTADEIVHLLHFASSQGIKRFDTAAVYGAGSVEAVLGQSLPQDAVIVTKVPAKSRPTLDTSDPISSYYDRDWIKRNVEESLERLRRTKADIVLLHNWTRNWGSRSLEPLAVLDELRSQGVIERLGISLPDGFSAQLDRDVVSCVDVIEAPYNPLDRWIVPDLPGLLRVGKEVILRSIFLQGLLLMDEDKRQRLSLSDIRRNRFSKTSHLRGESASTILQEVWRLETSVAIGMTTTSQIVENLRYLRKEG